jgi:hypothetical protein
VVLQALCVLVLLGDLPWVAAGVLLWLDQHGRRGRMVLLRVQVPPPSTVSTWPDSVTSTMSPGFGWWRSASANSGRAGMCRLANQVMAAACPR